jgi:hypothetical protein
MPRAPAASCRASRPASREAGEPWQPGFGANGMLRPPAFRSADRRALRSAHQRALRLALRRALRLALRLGLLFAGACAAAHAATLAALDCDDVGGQAVSTVLAHAPAPRLILIKGTLPQVTLDSLAHFLSGMGYPLARIADPRDGSLSRSGYEDSAALAGEVAWQYEHDGMAPILVGHSRGGMLVIRTLHTLAGAFGDAIEVRDPGTGRGLARTAIVDPATGVRRPVLGLTLDFAAVIATGKLPRIWQGQWDMLPLLRRIPDTVRDFLGLHIEGDVIAGDVFGIERYVPVGSAHVRNVVLPATYSHIGAPDTAHLAADPSMRAWIDAWRPGSTATPPPGDTRNLGLAVELWYGIKRAWCREAQQEARH